MKEKIAEIIKAAEQKEIEPFKTTEKPVGEKPVEKPIETAEKPEQSEQKDTSELQTQQ